jgi:hypothetical protein
MKSIVALGRRGFEVDFLTLSQLEKVCKDMEKNHFLTRGIIILNFKIIFSTSN